MPPWGFPQFLDRNRVKQFLQNLTKNKGKLRPEFEYKTNIGYPLEGKQWKWLYDFQFLKKHFWMIFVYDTDNWNGKCNWCLYAD